MFFLDEKKTIEGRFYCQTFRKNLQQMKLEQSTTKSEYIKKPDVKSFRPRIYELAGECSVK